MANTIAILSPKIVFDTKGSLDPAWLPEESKNPRLRETDIHWPQIWNTILSLRIVPDSSYSSDNICLPKDSGHLVLKRWWYPLVTNLKHHPLTEIHPWFKSVFWPCLFESNASLILRRYWSARYFIWWNLTHTMRLFSWSRERGRSNLLCFLYNIQTVTRQSILRRHTWWVLNSLDWEDLFYAKSMACRNHHRDTIFTTSLQNPYLKKGVGVSCSFSSLIQSGQFSKQNVFPT